MFTTITRLKQRGSLVFSVLCFLLLSLTAQLAHGMTLYSDASGSLILDSEWYNDWENNVGVIQHGKIQVKDGATLVRTFASTGAGASVTNKVYSNSKLMSWDDTITLTGLTPNYQYTILLFPASPSGAAPKHSPNGVSTTTDQTLGTPLVTLPLAGVTFSPATYNGAAQSPLVASVSPTGASYNLSYSQTAPGTYSVSITGTGSYTGTVSGNWTINKASGATPGISPTTQAVSTGSAITFTASGGSTGNYTWGGTAGATGSGASKSFTFNSPGSYTVTVVDAGDGNYESSTPATATITVTTGTTFSISPLSFVYNGAAQGPVITPTPAAAAGSWSVTNGQQSATNVGTYTVTATANGSYSGSSAPTSWSIVKATQAIAVTPGSQSVSAGTALTFTASGGGTGSYTWSGSSGASGAGTTKSLTFASTGTYTVIVTDAGNGNYNSASTTVTITVTAGNHAPSVNTYANPMSIVFGQSTYLTSIVTDSDSNLQFSGFIVDTGDGLGWRQDSAVSYWPVWPTFATTNEVYSSDYVSAVSGTPIYSSTKHCYLRPNRAGNITVQSNAADFAGTWASWDAVSWAASTPQINVVVSKATPVWTTANMGLFGQPHTITAGELTAAFSNFRNPWSSVVPAPTGAVSYSITWASSGASPGSGAVTAGTVLNSGTYSITASYPGDSNYAATSVTTSWTVNTRATLSIAASPKTINFGQTTTVSVTTSDVDGNLYYLAMMESSNGGNTYTRPNVDYARIGWNTYPVGAGWSAATRSNDQIAAPNFGPVTLQATFQPQAAKTHNILAYSGDNSGPNYGAWLDWAENGGKNITVNHATPNLSAFADQTYAQGSPITAAMLNVVASNPYSTAVTPPSGAITYSASGYGAVTVGTVLPGGSFALTATYNGDSNYNATSKTATFSVVTVATPSITVTPSTMNFGQSATVSFDATQTPFGVGGTSCMYYDNGTWRSIPGVSYDVTNWPASYPNDTTVFTYSSSTFTNEASDASKGFVITPKAAGGYYNFGAYAWDAKMWSGSGWVFSPVITVNKTTPEWVKTDQSFAGTHTIVATDMVAAMHSPHSTAIGKPGNPYSSTVAAPTGPITFAITAASGGGATPTGAITLGSTVLKPGTYTITEYYPGDSNYNAISDSTTWTIVNVAPTLPTLVINATTYVNGVPTSGPSVSVYFGQSFTLQSTAADPDGNGASHYFMHDNGDPIYWVAERAGSSMAYTDGAGWSGVSPGNAFGYGAGFAATFTPPKVPSQGFYRIGSYVWDDSGASNANYGGITVNKATPNLSALANQTFASGTALTAAMLNVTASNPYSGAVAAPSGSVAYSAPGYPSIVAGTVLANGSYLVTASYPGDGNYNATSTTATFTVVAPPTPTITVSPSTMNFGQSATVTFSATQAPQGAGGTSSMYYDGAWHSVPGVTHNISNWAATYPNDTTVFNYSASTFTNETTTTSKSFVITAKAAGSFGQFGTFAWDALIWSGSGWVFSPSVVVNKTTPVWSTSPASFTGAHVISAADLNNAFASFRNPYSAAVAAPTGAVSYSITAASGSGTTSPTGGVTAGTTSLLPGSYTITASYPGDANYNSASATSAWTIGNIAPTVTSLTATPSSINFGQTASISATVTDSDSNLYGFAIMRFDGATYWRLPGVDQSRAWGNGYAVDNTSGTYSGQPVNDAPVSGGASSWAFTYRPASASSTQFHANAHDGFGWASGAGYVTLTVNKATPSLTVFNAQSFTYGTAVTAGMLNVTASNPYTGAVAAPSGAITYSASGYGAISVGTVLPAGSYDVTANYPGDGNYNSTSATATFTVSKAGAATPSLTPSANPSTFPAPVTCVYANTTTNQFAWTINGTQVAIFNGAAWSSYSGSYVSGTWAISSGYLVVTPTSTTGYTVMFSDLGNANYSAADSATVTQTINKANQAALNVTASPSTAPYLGSSTLSTTGGNGDGAVTYSSAAGGSISSDTFTATSGTGPVVVTATKAADTNYNAQTGTVTITLSRATPTLSVLSGQSLSYGSAITAGMLNVTPSGSGVAPTGAVSYSASGYGAITVGTILPGGAYTVTATYPGDSNYSPNSTTATFNIVVPPAVTITVVPATVNFGQSSTVTLTASQSPFGLGILTCLYNNGTNHTLPVVTYNWNTGWPAAYPLDTTFSYSASTFGDELASGASSTKSFAITANAAGSYGYFHTRSRDSFKITLTTAMSANIVVNKATPTLSAFSDQAFAYGSAVTAGMLNVSPSNPYSGAVAAPTGAITYDAAGYGLISAGAVLPAGSYTVTAAYPGDGNYNSTSTTATFTVIKANAATPTVTPSANPSTVMSAVTYTPSGGTTGLYGWNINGTQVATYNGSSWTATSGAYTGGTWSISGLNLIVTSSSATNYTVVLSDLGNTNYTAADSATLTQTVNKANQAALIVSASPTTVPYQTTSELSTTGGSGGGLVTYTSAAGGSISGSTFTATGTNGTVVVTATKAADANYLAQTGTVTITLSKATPTLSTLGAQSFSYGVPVTAEMLNVTASGAGVAPAGAITYSASGYGALSAGTVLPVNTYTVTASYPGDGNYNSATTTATWTVSNTVPVVSLTVNGTTSSIVGPVAAADISFGQSIAVSSTATDADGNLTHHSIVVREMPSGAFMKFPGADYLWGSPTYVDSASWTACSQPAGNTVSSGSSNTVTGTFLPPSAILYRFRAPAADALAVFFNDPRIDVTVQKATPTLSAFSNQSFAYGSAITAGMINVTASNPYNGTVTAPSGAITYSAAGYGAISAGTVLPAGSYTVTASYPGDANYNATATAVTFTVNAASQAAPTWSTTSQNLTYGAAYTIPTLTNSGQGALVWTRTGGSSAGATVNSSSGAISYTGVGTITLTATYAATANYSVSPDSATYTVTVNQRSLPVTGLSAQNKAYDTTTTATLSGSSTIAAGLVNGDTTANVVLSGASAAANFASAAVANNVAVTVTGYSLTGTQAGNYTIVQPTGITANITKATSATPAISASANPSTVLSAVTYTPSGGTTGLYGWTINGTQVATYNGSTWTATSGSYTGGTWAISGLDLIATSSSVTNYTVLFSDLGNTNYSAADSAMLTQTINKANQAALIVSSSPTTVPYFTSSALSTTGGSGGGLVTYTSAAGGSITGSSFKATKASGTVVVTATKAGDSIYNAQTGTVTITTVKADATTPVISPSANPSTFPAAVTFTPSNNTTSNLSWSINGTVICTFTSIQFAPASGSYAGGTWSTSPFSLLLVVTPTSATNFTIAVTDNGAGNYNAATSATLPQTVNKANQAALTVSASPTTVAHGSTSALSTTGGTGAGAVSYSSAAGGSISGSTFTADSGTGTVVVTATKAGGSNYNDQTGTVTITFSKATPTLSALSNQTFTAGAAITPEMLSVSASNPYSGSVAAPTGAITYSASGFGAITEGTVLHAGTYTVTASYPGDVNHNANTTTAVFTVNKDTQSAPTLTGAATLSYGDSAALTPSGGSGGGAWLYSVSGSAGGSMSGNVYTPTANGTASITVQRDADADHEISQASTAVTITVNAKALTVTGLNYSPKPYDRTTTANATGTPALVGVVGSDDVVLTGSPAYAFASANVGTGRAVSTTGFTLGGQDAGKYILTPPSGTADITKASQAISFDPLPSATFGDTPFQVSAIATSGLPVTFSVTSGPATIAGSTVTITGAGSVALQASQAGDSNYEAAPVVSQSFVVAQAAQAPLVIKSGHSIFVHESYTATATGGSGTGALVWSLGAGTTAQGDIDASSGVVTTSTSGTIVLQVRRAADANYAESAPSDDFVLTVNSRDQSVSSRNDTVTVDDPFTPYYSGGSGDGAWEMQVSSGPWTALGPIDTSVVGSLTFSVRKLGDAVCNPSPSAGPYTLTVNLRPQAQLSSAGATVLLNAVFTPPISGAENLAIVEMKVSANNWQPLAKIDTSVDGPVTFFVRKGAYGKFAASPVAGPYTLVVQPLNKTQHITVRANNDAVWAAAAGSQIYRKATTAGTVESVTIMQYRVQATKVVNGNLTLTDGFSTNPEAVTGPDDYAHLLFGYVPEEWRP